MATGSVGVVGVATGQVLVVSLAVPTTTLTKSSSRSSITSGLDQTVEVPAPSNVKCHSTIKSPVKFSQLTRHSVELEAG